MRQARRGFSLLETVVVIGVTGLVMAIAAPRFAQMRDSAATRGAGGDIGAAFSVARETALATRTPVAIVFDTVAGTIELHSAGQTLQRRALTIVYGVRLAANRDSAVYDPRGFGSGVSNLTVTVRRGVFVDTLTMSRLGRVRW